MRWDRSDRLAGVALLVLGAVLGGATAHSVPAARAFPPSLARDVSDPESIQAVYLSYYGIADAGIRGGILDLLEHTELNAVVIDVKGDRGFVSYATSVDLAVAAGARGPVRWDGFDATLQH